MSLQEELLELSEAAGQISRGVNAVALMSKGLNKTLDPFADGFGAISDYLITADRELRERLDACLNAM